MFFSKCRAEGARASLAGEVTPAKQATTYLQETRGVSGCFFSAKKIHFYDI
jgi:hypothetical protein